MLKRLISLNLAIIMACSVFSVFPRHAYAATDDNGYAIYYKNDGSGESSSQEMSDFASNSSLLLYEAAPEYAEHGKVVVAYNTEADGSGTTYALTELISSTHSREESNPAHLYAIWADAPEPYILFLNADCTDPLSDTYSLMTSVSEEIELPGEEVFPNCDKTVVGWRTMLHAYGQSFTPGQQIIVDESITLLPIFGINYINYHVPSYDSDTGSYIWATEAALYTWDSNISYRTPSHMYGKMFTGWNTQPDGSGMWYTETDSVDGAPHDLYAIYEDYPSEDYVIIRCESGLSSGKMCDFVLLSNNEATLPRNLRNGNVAAAWLCGSGDNAQYYPCEITQTITSGRTLRPEVVNEDMYYGLIDGNGGRTSSGSSYYLVKCVVTSAGDLNCYMFNDIPPFTKDESVLVGYRGERSQHAYDFNDDIWAAMKKEAGQNRIAAFTAQYEETGAGSILYLGNGQYTAEWKSSVRQDIVFNNVGDTRILNNPFTAPAGAFFIGWNTKADGSGAWYDAGATIPFDQNTVLYAQWGQNRITYHYESRWGESVSSTITNHATINRSMSNYAHTSDVFEGWTDQQDAWYLPNESIEDGIVLDLYENWLSLPTEGNYYVLNGTKMQNGRMAQLYMMETPSETVALPDLECLGWYLDGTYNSLKKQGNLKDADFFRPGQEVAIQNGAIMHALEAKTMVTYNKNNGADVETQTYYNLASNSNLQLLAPKDVFASMPESVSFAEWNTEQDGSGESYGTNDDVYGEEYYLYAQWKTQSVINNEYTFVSSRKVDPGESVPVTSNGAGWYFFVIDCSSTASDLRLYDSNSGRVEMITSHSNSVGDSKTERNHENVFGAYLPAGGQYRLDVVGYLTEEEQHKYNEEAPYTLLTYYTAELPALQIGAATTFNPLDDARMNWPRRFATFTPPESGWYRLSTPNDSEVYLQRSGLSGHVNNGTLYTDGVLSYSSYPSDLKLLHGGETYVIDYHVRYNNWANWTGEYGVTRAAEPTLRTIQEQNRYPLDRYSRGKIVPAQSGVYCLKANVYLSPSLYDSDGVEITGDILNRNMDQTVALYNLEEGKTYYYRFTYYSNWVSEGRTPTFSIGQLDSVIARSEVELCGIQAPNGNRDSQTNHGNLITEAMRWKALSEGNIGVDDSKVVAVTNGGGIRAAINVGDITRMDINKVLPFGNTVAVVYVTGAELLEALEASTYCIPSKLGGYPQTTGICWTLNTLEAYDANDKPYPESVYYGPASIRRVTIESINGKPFNVTDTYAVVTNNFCASGGDTYYAFHRAYEEKAGFDTGILLDDAVCEYIETELKGVISEKYATDRGDLTMITADTVTASGTMGSNDEISWSYRGYKRQLTIIGDEISTDKPLYVAEYADNGKMLGVTVITDKNATISTKDQAKEVKLMWLDKDGAPLCRPELIQSL